MAVEHTPHMHQMGIGGFFGSRHTKVVEFRCTDVDCPALKRSGVVSTFTSQKGLNAHVMQHRAAATAAEQRIERGEADEALRNNFGLMAVARASTIAAPKDPMNDISPIAVVGNSDEPEDEEELEERDQGPPLLLALQPRKKKTKGAKKRFTYSLVAKSNAIQAYDALRTSCNAKRTAANPPRALVDDLSVRSILSKELGVPIGTIYDWIHNRSTILAEYEKRRAVGGGSRKRLSVHAKRVFVKCAGRPPLFARAEAQLAEHIRARRTKQLSYPASQLQPDLRKYAQLEAMDSGVESILYSKWEKSKFTTRMVRGFLLRNRLSIRVPSCLKTKSLAEMVLLTRGYFKALEQILLDPGFKARGPLDPSWGRFPPKRRINKDEVPLFWGNSSHQVQMTSSKATHVLRCSGFGDRIATMDLAVTADGYVLPVLLIFKGTGKQVEKYNQDGTVVVHFQPKAWKDGEGELLWYRRVAKPYLDLLCCELGIEEANLVELLLQHDNVVMHHDFTALRWAHEHVRILSINPPPESTNYVQLIDDNIGKLFRADIEALVVAHMDEKGHDYKWKAHERRKLMVDSTAATVLEWRADLRKKQLLIAAATRTGLRFEVQGRVPVERTRGHVEPSTLLCTNNPGLQPVRFPLSFGASVSDPTHAAYSETVPFTPFMPKSGMRFDPDDADADSPPPLARRVPLTDVTAALEMREEEAEFNSDVDEFDFGPEYASELDGDQVEDAAEDDVDNQVQYLERATRRGCLPGCLCEDDLYRRGCVCFSTRDHCLEQCECNCSRSKQALVVEALHFDNEIQLQIGLQGGEMLVTTVMDHEEEDGALYFKVLWFDGTTTEEPLENLMDKDGVVNAKLLDYAVGQQLDLAPYVKIMLTIISGERDSYGDSASNGN